VSELAALRRAAGSAVFVHPDLQKKRGLSVHTICFDPYIMFSDNANRRQVAAAGAGTKERTNGSDSLKGRVNEQYI
jgi:hypothetical protein